MADPAIVAITPEKHWVKVATNVTSGRIHALKGGYDNYKHTYRLTGEDAPDDSDNFNEAVSFAAITETISHSAAIDAYVMTLSGTGSVRVDV